MKEIFDLLRKEASEHVDLASQIYGHEPVLILRDVNQILDLAQYLWEKKQVELSPAVSSDNIPDGYYYIKDGEVFHEDGYFGTSEKVGFFFSKEDEQRFRESIIDEFAEKAKKDFGYYDTYLIFHSNGIMNPQESIEYYQYMIDDFARELKGEKTLSFKEYAESQKENEHERD